MKTTFLSIAATMLSGATMAGPALHPGLWRFDNVPVGATLDGRAIADLPYTPAGAQEICMSTLEAADPARWFLRDSGTGCSVTRGSIAHGRVDIAARCPGQATGNAPGLIRLTGTWAPDRYALRFATTAVGENGTMGFTGTITGRRVGACPAR